MHYDAVAKPSTVWHLRSITTCSSRMQVTVDCRIIKRHHHHHHHSQCHHQLGYSWRCSCRDNTSTQCVGWTGMWKRLVQTRQSRNQPYAFAVNERLISTPKVLPEGCRLDRARPDRTGPAWWQAPPATTAPHTVRPRRSNAGPTHSALNC